MNRFKLISPYKPAGDQPKAIAELVAGLKDGEKSQMLLGATGTGKTFTMAQVMSYVQRPTLIISPNKTLAAQLYGELKSFFPNNSVEYFVSYYDYFQPEAYVPSTGIYIEKDLSINEQIEKLRLRATTSLLSGRRDVVIISSVSCIYGMSDPQEFSKQSLEILCGTKWDREKFLLQLVQLHYHRDENSFGPGNFRVQGDSVDIFLPYSEEVFRFYFFGEEIEDIEKINPITGQRLSDEEKVIIYPGNLFVVSKDNLKQIITEIEKDLEQQILFFTKLGREQEAQRLEKRTKLDLEMMRELGYCSGIENYSRYFDRRSAGERPFCLLNYFPSDFLLFIDESHIALPQIRGMHAGDQVRKKHLVEHGFRLPSALDNRPLNFEEFNSLIGQKIFVSATPGDYELEQTKGLVVEQLIRPTGLLDPKITVHPTLNQMDILLGSLNERIAKGQQTLVITLTKRMAEELTLFLKKHKIKCKYIHSEVDTLDRVEILKELGDGDLDALIGVNLLREGLDLPGVSLVVILDADKMGFLRNKKSLLQMIGRAARHIDGEVYMYADKVTSSMKEAIEETNRRREMQQSYNIKHNITPKGVINTTRNLLLKEKKKNYSYSHSSNMAMVGEEGKIYKKSSDVKKAISMLKKEIQQASDSMNYLKAHHLQKELIVLQENLKNRKD